MTQESSFQQDDYASLKEQKELFVTGHDGTTPWEILLVSSAAPVGIWLFQSIRALGTYLEDNDKQAPKNRSNPPTTNNAQRGTIRQQRQQQVQEQHQMQQQQHHHHHQQQQQQHLSRQRRPKQTKPPARPIFSKIPPFVTAILTEAGVLWLPFLICQTNLLYPWGAILLCGQVQICILIWAYFWTTQRWMKIRNMNREQQQSMERLDEDMDEDEIDALVAAEQVQLVKDSMTIYRSSMLYMTFIAILAVDFHVFPRRFAKTEVAGYGLMDLGAGSFVVAAGLVSARARQSPSPSQQQSHKSISFGKKDLVRILPLLLLGFVRLATNKGLEYQEHVSEYGVHWNFFFTLAVVTPLGSILPGRPHWIVPACLLAAYQYGLTALGGQDFIEHAERTHCSSPMLAQLIGDGNSLQNQMCTLFAANREGILGCIGYLSLYLVGEYIAYAFLWTTTSRTTKNGNGTLWVVAIGLWMILYGLVEHLEIPVSRRSTNASFVVWTLAHNMVLLAAIHSAMCLYEDPRKLVMALTTTSQTKREAVPKPRVPIVFQAVNRHGFLAFLVANLLTGLTNLSINTLAVSDPVALLILFVYLCAVGGFSLVLHFVLEASKTKGGDILMESGKVKAKTE